MQSTSVQPSPRFRVEPEPSSTAIISKNAVLPLALLILLGLIWGGFPNLGKYAGIAGIDPINYAFQSILIGACGLFVFNALRGRRLPLSSEHLRYYIISGLLSTAVPSTVMYTVLKYIPAGMMAILMALIPIMAYVMAIGLAQEKPRLMRSVGIGIGLAGVLLLVMSRGGVAGDIPKMWLMIGLITPVCYAAGNLYNHMCRPKDTEPLVAAGGMLIGASVSLLAILLLTNGITPAYQFGAKIVLLTILHGAATAIAFAVFFTLLKKTGPVYISQVAYLVTIFGIGIGMWLFAERFNHWFWLALLLVFFGVLLVNQRKS